MNNPPSGTVTFLFAEIEKNKLINESSDEIFQTVLQKFRTIFNYAVESNNGFIFKVNAGEVYASFQTPSEAVLTAVDIQREIISENGMEINIKIKTGIHTGEAEWTGEDYVGYITLTRTQRIMSVANGGQILISGDSIDDDKNISVEISYRDIGERKLKNITLPVRLFQVNAPGIELDFNAIKSLDERQNNLPVQITSFIGREKEIAEIKALLKETHLLTLVGSGGTGKTRVALQSGKDIIDEFENGVWFIGLASVKDPVNVSKQIASVFNLSEDPKKKIIDTVIDYLKDKELLLILDNCEHLINECAVAAKQILNTCSRIKIIASSRESLKLFGEAVYKVQSLSFPREKEFQDPEIISQYESVRLFIERALLVKPDFKVTNENIPAVAQLCYTLDGIPLAIELAAARMKVLSVERILEKISDRFKFLTGGSRTALPHQQTLRAMIDWSYDLLPEKEKILFQHLTIFSGGWTVEAAEEICGGIDEGKDEIIDLMTNLLDKSIIYSIENSGSTRFNMLESIRQYGGEKFEEKLTDKTDIQNKHFEFYLKLLKGSDDMIHGKDQTKCYAKAEPEQDNLRSALKWSIENTPAVAIQLVKEVMNFWEFTGNFSEAIEIFKRITAKDTELDIKDKSEVQVNAGYLACNLGDYENAENYLNESLKYFKTADNKEKICQCLNTLGILNFNKEELGTARKLYEESIQIGKEINNKETVANALINLSSLNQTQGEYDLAFQQCSEALKVYTEVNNKHSIARALANMAALSYQRGDLKKSMVFYEQTLPVLEEIKDFNASSIVYLNLGNLYYSLKKYSDAEHLYEQSLALSKEFGYTNLNSHSLIRLADIALIRNQTEKAGEVYISCIKNCDKKSDKHKLGLCFTGLGYKYFAEGNYEYSLMLLGFSEELFHNIGVVISNSKMIEFKNKKEEIKKIISDQEFGQYMKAGKEMNLDEAILLSLRDDKL